MNAENARGTLLFIREMARRRQRRSIPNCRIIKVASLAGQVGGLQSGAAYSASKGAVSSLTKACARELAPSGITVHCIAPGPIDMPMLRATVRDGGGDQLYMGLSQVPFGRVGTPQEITAAAAHLVSKEAGFVTGSTIDVKGGMRMQ